MAHERGVFWRTHEHELHIRSADDDPRTVYGTVVPYNQPATVNDGEGPYREQFAPGAFQRSLEQRGKRVALYQQHNRQVLPLARMADWSEEPGGLVGYFRLQDNTEGNAVLDKIRDGIVDSFSVGFRGLKARTSDDGVVTRTEADLLEVSLVAEPAYSGATIAGVRMADIDTDELNEWIESLTPTDRAALEAALLAPASGTGESPDDGPASGTAGPIRTVTLPEVVLRLKEITRK